MLVRVALDPKADAALDRPVATKFLKDPEGDAKGLLREALVTGRLEHPNIVPVFDFGRTGDQVFLAMERVEGKDLGSTLARPGAPRLPPVVAAFIAGLTSCPSRAIPAP